MFGKVGGVSKKKLRLVGDQPQLSAVMRAYYELVGVSFSLQAQPVMPQSQAVAQVQTGVQSQVQLWQLQETLDETVEGVGFVFMDDLVSSLSTEPFAESYRVRCDARASPLRLTGKFWGRDALVADSAG